MAMIDPAGIYSHGISLLLVLGVMNPITYSDTADTHSVAERETHSTRLGGICQESRII